MQKQKGKNLRIARHDYGSTLSHEALQYFGWNLDAVTGVEAPGLDYQQCLNAKVKKRFLSR